MDDDDVQDNKVFFCSEDVFDDAQRLGRHRRGDSRARQLRFGIPEFHVGEYDDDDEAGKRTTTIEEGGAAHRVLASRAGMRDDEMAFFLYLISLQFRGLSLDWMMMMMMMIIFVLCKQRVRRFGNAGKKTTALFFFFFFFFFFFWT